jgi:ribosomal protein L36
VNRKRGDEKAFSNYVVRRKGGRKVFCEHKDRKGGNGK